MLFIAAPPYNCVISESPHCPILNDLNNLLGFSFILSYEGTLKKLKKKRGQLGRLPAPALHVTRISTAVYAASLYTIPASSSAKIYSNDSRNAVERSTWDKKAATVGAFLTRGNRWAAQKTSPGKTSWAHRGPQVLHLLRDSRNAVPLPLLHQVLGNSVRLLQLHAPAVDSPRLRERPRVHRRRVQPSQALLHLGHQGQHCQRGLHT